MGFFSSSSNGDGNPQGQIPAASVRARPSHARDPKRRAFRVNTISMMKSKKDPDMKEQLFETVCTVPKSSGNRVRITLENGQYFVLRIPAEFDGRFHEITSNERYTLETKFATVDGGKLKEPTITYESALAKGNALILLLCLAQALCRRDLFPNIQHLSVNSLDFYLCCGAMTVLYVLYLAARARVGGSGAKGSGGLIQITLRSVEKKGGKASGGGSKGAGSRSSFRASSSAGTKTKSIEKAPESRPGGGAESSVGKSAGGGAYGKANGGGEGAAPMGGAEASQEGGGLPRSVSGGEIPDVDLTQVPPVSTWIHSPLLIRAAPHVPHKVDGIKCTATSQLRVNKVPIPFETDLFKGVAMIRVANLSDSPKGYFKGRNRKLQVAIQGQFKKKTRFDKVFSGQEFYQKIPSLPPKRVVDTVFSLLSSKLPPTFLQDVFADKPFFLSPLVNTCQGFAVEKDGEVQDVAGLESERWAVKENTELLGDEVPRNAEKRRKFFATASNLERFHFDPALHYTFDYYQHFMDMNSMRFVVTSFLGFDVSGIIGKQPMQLSMAKNMDGEGYYWNFESWHKTLMEEEGGEQ